MMLQKPSSDDVSWIMRGKVTFLQSLKSNKEAKAGYLVYKKQYMKAGSLN
jgi:hypothetical protein